MASVSWQCGLQIVYEKTNWLSEIETWLKAGQQQECKSVLNEFLNFLLKEIPLDDSGLVFKRRFTTLPKYVQVRLAQLVWMHENECSKLSVEHIARLLADGNSDKTDWLCMINNQLSNRGQSMVTHQFSETNYAMLEEVLGPRLGISATSNCKCSTPSAAMSVQDCEEDDDIWEIPLQQAHGDNAMQVDDAASALTKECEEDAVQNGSPVFCQQRAVDDVPKITRVSYNADANFDLSLNETDNGRAIDDKAMQIDEAHEVEECDDVVIEYQQVIERVRECWLGGTACELANLTMLLSTPASKSDEIVASLDLTNVSDQALLAMSNQLAEVADSITGADMCKSLLSAAFVPKICALTSAASRNLMTCLTSVGKRLPHHLLDAVLLPSLVGNSGRFQCSAIQRVAKEVFDQPLRSNLLRVILSSAAKITLTDDVLQLLQEILDAKVSIDDQLVFALVMFADQTHATLCSNLKFAKLLLSVITHCQSTFTSAQKSVVRKMVESNKTLLHKSLANSLN